MSEKIGSAYVEVGVDSSNVEAGFAKIDAAVTKTGRTLENLGSGAGKQFDAIGLGGDASSKKVEAATKNMIGSIQRTTAALESGSKTSAQYYEALANQRGVNVDALRPYLEQLEAVKAKQEAAAQATDETSESIGGLGGVAGRVAPMLAALAGAVSVGAFAGMVKGAIDAADAASKLAQRTGLAVEAMQKYAYIAEANDTSAEAFGNSIKKLSANMAGSSKDVQAAFKSIGVATKNSNGSLRSSEEVLEDVAGAFGEMEDGVGKTALAMKLFGESGTDIIPLLNGGKQALKDTAEEAVKFGLILGGDAVAAAEEFNDNIGRMGKITQGAFTQIADAALPTLADLSKALVDSATGANTLNGAAQDLNRDGSLREWAINSGEAVADLADIIGNTVAGIRLVTQTIGKAADIRAIDVRSNEEKDKITPGGYFGIRFLKGSSDEAKKLDEIEARRIESIKKVEDAYDKSHDKILAGLGSFGRNYSALREKQAAVDAVNNDPEIMRLLGRAPVPKADQNFGGSGSSAASTNKQADAHQNLISAINEKIAASAQEAASLKPLNDAQKLQISLEESLASGKLKLSSASKAAYEAKIKEYDANLAAVEANKEAKKYAEEEAKFYADQAKSRSDAAGAAVKAVTDEADRNEYLAKTFGMTKVAIEELEIARLQAELAQFDGIAANTQETSTLEALIEARKRNVEALGQGEAMAKLTSAAKTFGDMWKDILDEQVIGEAVLLANVIGNEQAKVVAHKAASDQRIEIYAIEAEAAINAARASAGGATDRQEEAFRKAKEFYDKIKSAGAAQFKIDFEIAGLKDTSDLFADMSDTAATLGDSFRGATDALGGFAAAFGSLAEIQKKEQETGKENMAARIGAYGDLAGAAKNFFEEGSSGHKTMDGIAKAAHAAQLAMQVVEMGQLAVKAVMNQAGGDPYTAFARMAAMAAIVGALGYGVGGGFNSSSGDGRSAADIQKTQGTGTVLGDADAKSASIANSIAMLEKNSSIELTYSSQMLMSLKSIDASMAGLSSIIYRTAGLTTGKNMGVFEGVLSVNKGDPIANAVGLGGLSSIGGLSKTLQSFWGKDKQKITDSGLTINGTVGGLMMGDGVEQYANIEKTSSSWFGLKKKITNTTKNAEVDAIVAEQFGKIFTGISETLVAAAGALSIDDGGLSDAISKIIIDIPKTSLKDLKGQDLQDALNAVISSASDDIAGKLVPGFEEFRTVGEGYFETIIKVASGVEMAEVALEKLGLASVDYTAIANKQGDISAEIVRQSIGAFESVGGTLTGIGQIISTMDGTTKDLTSTYGSLLDLRRMSVAVGLKSDVNINTIKGAGGVPELNAGYSDFFEKYFTEAEKAAAKSRELADSFAAIGIAMPASMDGFRALVTSLDDGTESSSRLIGKVLALSGAFADANPRVEAVTESVEDLANAAAAIAQSVFARSQTTLGNAQSSLNKSINAEKEAAEKKYRQQIEGINAQAAASQAANAANQASANESLQAITNIFDSLSSSLKALRPMARDVAQSILKGALDFSNKGGSLVKFEGLDDALQAVAKPSENLFSTFVDYQRDQINTANTIEALRKNAGSQMSVAQLTLDAISGSTAAINTASSAQISILTAQYDADIAGLDKILANAQEQTDALNGINSGTMSIVDALQKFTDAITGAVTAKEAVNPNISTVRSWYAGNENSTGMPDAEGLAYWVEEIAIFGLDAAKRAFAASVASITGAAPMDINSFAVGTNVVPYDMTARIHEGERIIPAADNRQLMARLNGSANSERVERLLEELLTEIKGSRFEGRAIAGHTEKTAGLLDRVIINDAITTKEAVA